MDMDDDAWLAFWFKVPRGTFAPPPPDDEDLWPHDTGEPVG